MTNHARRNMPTPLTANEGKSLPDVRVHILNPQGKYLAGDGETLYFTAQRAEALVLSYEADRVAEQLEAIRRAQGILLEAVPVPLEEIYETCDRCQELFMPFMTHFDGKQFLCVECGRLVSPRRQAKGPTTKT